MPTLVNNAAVRAALIPEASDVELATVLRLANQVAAEASRSFWGWEGYENDAIRVFIADNDPF